MPPTLLHTLDRMVCDQVGPAGFSGRIAVGVRGAEGTRWWVGDFRGRLRTTIAESFPEADAYLGLPEDEAAPPMVSGDIALLKKFANRYCTEHTALGLFTSRQSVR